MARVFGTQNLAPNTGLPEVPSWHKNPKLRRVLSLAMVASVSCSFAAARLYGGQVSHEGHQGGGPVPREILERPVGLRQGIGSVHEAVTTSSSEAQSFYDQGLAYAHSFMWIEAARSFHQALRLDPNLAMAFLGLTDTYIGLHDAATARAAFQRAQELAPKVSERERAWITIRERELDFLEDNASQESYGLYRQALKEALKANPNEPVVVDPAGSCRRGQPLFTRQAGGVDTLSFYKTAVTLAPATPWHTTTMRIHTKMPAGEGSA